MTDNEIKKALECCKKAVFRKDCLTLDCPLATKYGCNISQWCIDKHKKYAIKEFAERLKVLCRRARFSVTVTQDITGAQKILDNIAVVDERDIDNLVAEMAGDADVVEKVATILAEILDVPCNFSPTDEWLSYVCDYKYSCDCEYKECWKQLFKHWDERKCGDAE